MPQNPRFAAKFAESAQIAHAAAQALVDLLENYTDVETKVQRIRDLELDGDRISGDLTNLLAESFIVPFDREDILSLNHELNDLVGDLEEAARKLSLYGIQQPLPQMAQLAQVAERQCALLAQGLPLIEDNRALPQLRQLAAEIRRLEDEADAVGDDVARHLYDGVREVPQMILAMRSGEIIELLENATDQAKRVAKTVEHILLKNA
ncbi:DUF47 domain-containing protein [Deinococcus radiophilus]|uniref:DUF47 domain-containing protein n=1 Tax=Deinococcus radiophilus TaxID=32062 RepID=A0A431W639_9DEIO|nr:DUF47 family protein [Deinococcus radiophilus]RTR30965.1 DUF47 domain-containing protein [Deinococcus radiophilus]UFA51390.1 DUF47 family protein [Deinococcus radiophilus]